MPLSAKEVMFQRVEWENRDKKELLSEVDSKLKTLIKNKDEFIDIALPPHQQHLLDYMIRVYEGIGWRIKKVPHAEYDYKYAASVPVLRFSF